MWKINHTAVTVLCGVVQTESVTKKNSIRENSWFSGTHLSLEQAVKLTYYWVYELPNDFISRELKIGSDHTLVDWKNFARGLYVYIRTGYRTDWWPR